MNILYIFCLIVSPITMINAKRIHKDMLQHKSKTVYISDSSSSSEFKNDTMYFTPDVLKIVTYDLYDIHLTGTVRKYFGLEAALLNDGSNMLCSPVAALLPLGKLAYGASGETRRELLRATGVTRKSLIGSTFKQLLHELRYLPAAYLNLATRTYVSHDQIILDRFHMRCLNTFGSDVKKVKFHESTQTSMKINQWISENTGGKIKNVVSPNQIDKKTSILVVNAIYFKGEWEKPFSKAVIRDFYSPFGLKNVLMMARNDMYEYKKSDALEAEVIEIPYKEAGATMIIVLPYYKSSLTRLLRHMKKYPTAINDALHATESRKVLLSIPKFKMMEKLDLIRLYKKVGVRAIFEPTKSKLVKMAKGERLWVSEGVQVSYLEINERGSSVSQSNYKEDFHVDQNQIIFLANRPFLFYIQGVGEPLFFGVYNG